MKAILPAAGYATRMLPLTENRPKSLLEIGDKAIMDYSVEKILKFNAVDKIFLVSNNKFYPQFLEWRDEYNDIDIDILNDGSNCESERLGTVGDVYFALDKGKIDDDFLIVNPDNLFSFEFRENSGNYSTFCSEFSKGQFLKTGDAINRIFLNDAYCYFLKRKNLIGLIRIDDKEEVRKRGSARLDLEGKIIEFREKDKDAVFNICSVGIYFFDKDVKNKMKTYLAEGNSSDRFGDFIQWLYKKIDIYGYFLPPNERIFDIGSIDSYEKARKFLSEI